MAFSIAFKTPISTVTFEPSLQNADAVAIGIARDAASAAWAIVLPTWITAGLTLAALIAAGISVFYSFQALKTWRHQVIGEHELGRLIEALQSLHDLEATINNYRSHARHSTSLTLKEESERFRENLGTSFNSLLRATVGLDIVWDENFKQKRQAVDQLCHEIGLASNYLYEASDRFIIPKQLALLNFEHNGDQRRPIEATQLQLEDAKVRIKFTFDEIRAFLTEKLKNYARA